MLEIWVRDGKFVFTHWSGSEEEISDPRRRHKLEKDVLQKSRNGIQEQAWIGGGEIFPLLY